MVHPWDNDRTEGLTDDSRMAAVMGITQQAAGCDTLAYEIASARYTGRSITAASKGVSMADAAQRFNEISTHWSLIFQAHASADPAAADAQADLLLRYGAAVYQFLLGKLCDPEAAEELAQEFALRLVRGDFRRAHPDRGHFRGLLQTALTNLVIDYRRRQKTRHHTLPPDSPCFADLAVEDGGNPSPTTRSQSGIASAYRPRLSKT